MVYAVGEKFENIGQEHLDPKKGPKIF